jgi:O-antigen/teichoic acid export membrane protein
MLKAITNSFIIKILAAVINFGIVIYLSKMLGAEGKGTTGIFIATVALNVILIEFVGGSALTYFAPRYNFKSLIINSILWNIFICACSGIILLSLFSIKLSDTLFIVVASFLNGLLSLFVNMLTGKQKYTAVNFVLFLQPLLLLVSLALLFTMLELRVEFYYLAFIFSNLVVVIISFLNSRVAAVQSLPDATFSFLLKEGTKNQAAHVMQFLSQRLSFWLLAQKQGLGATGILSNAMQISEATWMASNSVAIVQYGKVSNEGNSEHMVNFALAISKLSVFLSFTGLIILGCLPPQFFSLIFGDEFSQTGILILGLAPGVSLFNILLIAGHHFSGLGKFSINTIAILAGFITTLLFTFIFWQNYSLKYAVLICTLSYSVSSLFILIAFLKKNGLSVHSLFSFKKDLETFRELIKNK